MAIETRIHNYWNHIIESASHKTGSLLIWDTGTYEVLPRKKEGIPNTQTTDDESSDSDSETALSKVPTSKAEAEQPQNKKLIAAFQTRYIRLRLHGTRLPNDYTIIMRLPSNEIIKRPTARRKTKQKPRFPRQIDSDADSDAADPEEDISTDTDEDAQTRVSNAYPGSTNDIGSIHQRQWFLHLDRQSSGFVMEASGSGKGKWIRAPQGRGFEPFVVQGRDYERSVVTGRLARDVERDEGVDGFVGRGGGWRGGEW